MSKEHGYGCLILFALLWVLGAAGWVANIIKLFHLGVDFYSIMFFMRVIGIFAAPLGAVLGYF